MTLERLIKERIRAEGSMPVAEYMALALAHPEYGYYTRKDPLGARGDFITAPEISQIFGEIIGAWLAMQWIIMGKPRAALAELGPGRGTLMSDILRATAQVKGFHESVTVHLMEFSPVLRQKQWSTLAGKHPHVTWHTGFAEIPAEPLLLVANEFFDALPIRQFLYQLPGGYHERMIGLNGKDELEFTAVSRLSSQLPPSLPAEPEEGVYEYSEAATQMALAIGSRIFTYGGAALIIDYGYEDRTYTQFGGYSPKPPRFAPRLARLYPSPETAWVYNNKVGGDTLQAVRDHAYCGVLETPSQADITAHVDFYNLTRAGATGGAGIHGPVAQGAFLNRLGARERAATLCENASLEQKEKILSGLDRLTAPNQMGELFKVLCLTHPTLPKPEGF